MREFKIIAIIREVKKEYIVSILKKLKEYEIDTIEFSLSNEKLGLDALDIALNEFKNDFDIGVGTVTQKRQIDLIAEKGVSFIFTPAFSEELTNYALEKKVKIIPGVFSPSEVQYCTTHGVNVMKLFPATELSLGFLKAMRGPFPDVELMAVGGVSNENIKDFYNNGYYGVALGSNIVKKGATTNDLKEIENNLIKLREKIGEFND